MPLLIVRNARACQNASLRYTAGTRLATRGEAAAPKKKLPLSSRNGELSEKAGFGCRGDRLSGPGKGRLGAGGTVWEKNPARTSRLEANGGILATGGRPRKLTPAIGAGYETSAGNRRFHVLTGCHASRDRSIPAARNASKNTECGQSGHANPNVLCDGLNWC